MAKTTTTKYDVSEHLRTPEEMAAYLEASAEEAQGDEAPRNFADDFMNDPEQPPLQDRKS